MAVEHTGKDDGYCIYKDPNYPVEDRIEDLMSRMNLQDKIGQMTQIERRVSTTSLLSRLSIGSVPISHSYGFSIHQPRLSLCFLLLGSILSAGGSGPCEKPESADWAAMVDGFQRAALESRLAIPLIYGIDAVHGNNSIYGATIFPHNIGLGATRFRSPHCLSFFYAKASANGDINGFCCCSLVARNKFLIELFCPSLALTKAKLMVSFVLQRFGAC